jgi:WD40 repeat protein
MIRNGAKISSWKPALTYPTGDSVRTFAWYPRMDSSDPSTCCFVGASRDQPCHLYDAYTGLIRATYRPYNGLDEMESPTVVCFSDKDGSRLVTGGFRTDRSLHVFDVDRPGRDPSSVLKLGKTRRSGDGQKGRVSALASSSNVARGILAVGTYSPGSVYLYDLRTYSASPVAEVVMTGTCVAGHGRNHGRHAGRKRRLGRRQPAVSAASEGDRDDFDDGHQQDDGNDDEDDGMGGLVNFSAAKHRWYQSRVRGGVTQLEFDGENSGGGCAAAGSSSGECNYLFSASRRSNAVLQWDLRMLSSSSAFCPGVGSFEVDNDTNQRVEFHLHDRELWTGGTDGCVRIYDRNEPLGTPARRLQKGFFGGDCVNGISLHEGGGGRGVPVREGVGTLLLAVTTGSRHFPTFDDPGDGSSSSDGEEGEAGSARSGATAQSTSRSDGTTRVYCVNRNG